MTLAQMESRFFELKGKLAVGQLAEDEFKRELEKLRFQDQQGRWWMIGAQTGRWYYYDGARWLIGQPPDPNLPFPSSPPSSPEEQPAAVTAPTSQARVRSGGGESVNPAPIVQPTRPDAQPMAPVSRQTVTPQPPAQPQPTSRPSRPTRADRVREEATYVHVPTVHAPHAPAPLRRFPPNIILLGAALVGLLLVALLLVAADNLLPRKPISSSLGAAFRIAPTPTEKSSTARLTPLPAQAENVDNLLSVGDKLLASSQFEPALTQYQAAAKLAPSNADVYTHWARALVLTGRVQEAIDNAQRATRLDPNSANAFAELARALAWSGQSAAAISAGEKAINLEPKNPTAHAFLAEAYLRAGRSDDAQKEVAAALELDDNNLDAHRAAGWVAVIAGRRDEATGEWQRAIDLEPNLFFYHYEFGQVYAVYLNDAAKAVPEYQKAIELYPPYVPSYNALGRALLAQNQPGPAILQFQKALTFDPNSSEAYIGLGLAFQKQDRCPQAIPYFQKSLQLNSGLNEAMQGLVSCGALAQSDFTPVPPVAGTPGLVAVPTAIVQATVVPVAAVTPTAGAASTKAPVANNPTPAGTGGGGAGSEGGTTGRIAFSVYDGDYHLYTTNPDGTDRKLIAELGSGPSFSPDGSQILYSSWVTDQRGIHRIGRDGTGDETISLRLEDLLPSWAPDGTRYVYATRAGLGGDINKRAYSIRIADPTKKIKQDPPPFVERAQYPVWGPNDKIVFRDCGFPSDTCGLAVVNADGSAKTPLTTINSTAPAWSPTGNKIAFTSDYGGNWDIYIVDANGGSPSRLTTDAAEDGLPTFSPDGKQIAFLSHRDGVWAIWAMGIDGSNPHKLFDLGGDPAGSVKGNTPGQPGQVWYEQKISWR